VDSENAPLLNSGIQEVNRQSYNSANFPGLIDSSKYLDPNYKNRSYNKLMEFKNMFMQKEDRTLYDEITRDQSK
jgi:hypothetical protein